MDKIPILIIAPFFAPQSHAAMFRVHKLVKYLPEYGYKPIVITTDINYNYNEDLTLLDELPSDVEIHRVKYREPTMRGLRMFFGGKDRTFKAMKKTFNVDPFVKYGTNDNKGKKKNFLRKIYSNIQHFFLTIPDAYWTWVHPASKEAKLLIKKYDIKLFYTSANPDSVLKIGLNLKDEYDIKWISDYRDPVGYGDRYNRANSLAKKIDQLWIKNSMREADVITGLSSAYQKIFQDLYAVPEKKYYFIPTGLDEKYVVKSESMGGTRYLLFIGEFQTKYDDYLFKIISKSIDQNLIIEKFKIKFIGRKEINEPIVTKLLTPYISLQNICEFIDHMPQIELYEKIQNAHACILISGGENFWWCNFAKMVDYIALKKSVLAHVSDPSEARSELDKSGLGVFLEGDESEDVKIFSTFMNSKNSTGENEYYKKYLASSQVKEFSKIFNNLLKEGNE